MQNSMNDRFGVNQLAGARTVSISAEDTNARTISLQAQDREGQDLYARCAFEAYLSSDAVGDALEAASAGLTTVAGRRKRSPSPRNASRRELKLQ